jgi:hypothetical protein
MIRNKRNSKKKEEVNKIKDHEEQVKEEALRAFEDRIRECEQPRIGYFELVPDDDANTEVLTNEQVYNDLQQLEKILDKNEDAVDVKTLAMRRKIKKKRV